MDAHPKPHALYVKPGRHLRAGLGGIDESQAHVPNLIR